MGEKIKIYIYEIVKIINTKNINSNGQYLKEVCPKTCSGKQWLVVSLIYTMVSLLIHTRNSN